MRDRKDCATIKVKNKLNATVMLWPADRVSNGNISLGTVQPSWPHDNTNAAINRQMTTSRSTTTIE